MSVFVHTCISFGMFCFLRWWNGSSGSPVKDFFDLWNLWHRWVQWYNVEGGLYSSKKWIQLKDLGEVGSFSILLDLEITLGRGSKRSVVFCCCEFERIIFWSLFFKIISFSSFHPQIPTETLHHARAPNFSDDCRLTQTLTHSQGFTHTHKLTLTIRLWRIWEEGNTRRVEEKTMKEWNGHLQRW